MSAPIARDSLALDSLAAALADINRRLTGEEIAPTNTMEELATTLERSLALGRPPTADAIASVLSKFLSTGELLGYREIKTACHGLMVPFDGTRTLLSSVPNLQYLLRLVDGYQSNPRRLLRCFQALMAAYFSFDGSDPRSSHHSQWVLLQTRLGAWVGRLAQLAHRAQWLETALEHRNLFTETPTARYAARVLTGDSGEIDSLCERLSIGRDSWVRRRVIISAIEIATAGVDTKFVSHLDTLIGFLEAHPGLRAAGVARLLNRYVDNEPCVEHAPLRALAIDSLGNPLIMANKPDWFEVSPQATEMVSDWLKSFLIGQFFEVLGQDGWTRDGWIDERRARFWRQYLGSIDALWFILDPAGMPGEGSRGEASPGEASRVPDDELKSLRSTLGSHWLTLDDASPGDASPGDASPGNHALILKIGSLMVVEFAETGRPAFLFNEDSLPFKLIANRVSLRALESPKHIGRLVRMGPWEANCVAALQDHGISPDVAPSTTNERTGRASSGDRLTDGIRRNRVRAIL